MDWLTVVSIIIGSSVLSTLLNIWYSSHKTKKEEENKRYEKLYGPLRFKLQMMKIIVENREDVLKEIQNWGDPARRVVLMQMHMSPLTQNWVKLRDEIKDLFEKNPGLIRKNDFALVSDFMDGCLKREIIENGTNDLAENKNRITKLLDVIKKLQDKLL